MIASIKDNSSSFFLKLIKWLIYVEISQKLRSLRKLSLKSISNHNHIFKGFLSNGGKVVSIGTKFSTSNFLSSFQQKILLVWKLRKQIILIALIFSRANLEVDEAELICRIKGETFSKNDILCIRKVSRVISVMFFEFFDVIGKTRSRNSVKRTGFSWLDTKVSITKSIASLT